MIFVTVGHQTPFDRLLRAVDRWAERSGRHDVFAQLGKTLYRPKNYPGKMFITPQEFRQRLAECSAVVAHAGTGTIIAAVQLGKPLLVLPRLAALGETRNDHQIPTARHFARAGYVLAASDENQLIERMNEVESFKPRVTIASQASPELLQRLRVFALGERVPAQLA